MKGSRCSWMESSAQGSLGTGGLAWLVHGPRARGHTYAAVCTWMGDPASTISRAWDGRLAQGAVLEMGHSPMRCRAIFPQAAGGHEGTYDASCLGPVPAIYHDYN